MRTGRSRAGTRSRNQNSNQYPGRMAEPEAPDIQDATPPLPSAPEESPTPPFVNTRHLRTLRDPRTPAPTPEATPVSRSGPAPAPESTPESTPDSTPVPAPRPASASTEAASELRSDTRSRTPSGNSVGTAAAGAAGAAAPTVTGVSLLRAQAQTERRPAPATPAPLPMPPGELPGPAVPADPRHRRRAGRRTGLVAAVGVVTAGAVVAIVLAATSGSPDDNRAGGSPSASSSQVSSQAPSTTPSDSPSPTVEGTSRPQSLPPGVRAEAGGFAWATPRLRRRDIKTGAEVHYTSPDGKQELAAKSSLARGDLMESWRTSEQNARKGRDYQKIRLEETTFRGNPAVVWEYTFTLEGVPWHAQLLGFNENGKSYQINTWYQPDIEAQALKTYGKVRDSFTVL